MSDPWSERPVASEDGFIRMIRAECLRRGWDVGELARRAGLSRTTLYYLMRGTTRRPHASTLNSIARALEIEPAALFRCGPDSSDAPRTFDPAQRPARRREFDRWTNRVIEVVARYSPVLFAGWTEAEWDELYSSFGTGGALSEEGVVEAATRMNQRRETVRRLQVVLETHLAEVAERVIETLFEMSRPQSNLAATSDPEVLVAESRPAHSEPDGRSTGTSPSC